jgi:transposase-like protein
VLQRFAESGLSLGAFCRREGLSASSFRLWRTRLTAEAGAAKSPAPKSPRPATFKADFVDLGALPAEPVRGADRLELRLDLGAGVTLHIVRG